MSEQEFIEALSKLSISVSEEQINQLNQYHALLVSWNEKMNLTGITEKSKVYLKHFYDSATLQMVLDLNTCDTLCDVGTGAGFPGLVLKILFPHLKITLVDSLNKRIIFLNEVIRELKLTNIETVHARAEEYASKNRECFDVVTARAVAPLNVLLEYTIPSLKVGKYFVAMKGNISQEIIEAKHALKELSSLVIEEKQFILPFENSTRTLVVIKKERKTNLKYPRKFSEMKKRPL